MKNPREANGADGYPVDNPAFEEAAGRVLEKRRGDIAQAERFKSKLSGKPPSRYSLLEMLARALAFLVVYQEESKGGPSDGGELRALIEDIREVIAE